MLIDDIRAGKIRQIVPKFQSVKSGIKRDAIKPLKKHQFKSRKRPFRAYDLETDLIKEGTPRVKYITAHGEDYSLSESVDPNKDIFCLAEILEREFITRSNNRYRFVAWNGNKYDIYFVARSLLTLEDIILRPYLTRSKSLRGLKVMGINSRKGLSWEFLDGMAMTGLDTVAMPLKKFVDLMAPEFPKLELDFSGTEFDPANPDHVAYAERDSEALYYAMKKANEIAEGLTGNELQPTLGNLGIKYFQAMMPDEVVCWAPNETQKAVMYGPIKRGGFCWIAKQYKGPIWKYDINQAYAAAMRDCDLPAGSCFPAHKFEPDHCGAYRVEMWRKERATVPFYYRDLESNIGYFTDGFKIETWILSNEIKHLEADGWTIRIKEGYYWSEKFNMKAMVDNLERLRFTDPGGPSGPLGTMVKTIANSAYGKTMEQLEGTELVMAGNCPEGFMPYAPEIEELSNIYFKEGEPLKKNYHCPQIGAFITAHVRMVVRQGALGAADHFIYADTDCLAFSAPVGHLVIDPRHYGDWKQESDGDEHIMIGKKIYYSADGSKHAKGLHIKNLERDDFEKWLRTDEPPTQTQTQRQNFVKFIAGQEMFRDLERKGTNVKKSAQANLKNGEFFACDPSQKNIQQKRREKIPVLYPTNEDVSK